MEMYQTSMIGLNKYDRRNAETRNKMIQETTGYYAMSGTQFFYKGKTRPFSNLIQKFDQTAWNTMTEASIDLSGEQIKSLNQWCCVCTLFCGGIFCFPFCLMCLDSWKRYTHPAYQINVSIYENLEKIFSAPNLRSVTLTVCDNLFNAQKANLLFKHLSVSKLTNFTFFNQTGSYDFQGTSYTDFAAYMNQIKSLNHIVTNLRWGKQILSK